LDTEFVVGHLGEFSVWVNDRKVVEKRWLRFPKEEAIVGAIRAALGVGAGSSS
jgi:hypothetical protein